MCRSQAEGGRRCPCNNTVRMVKVRMDDGTFEEQPMNVQQRNTFYKRQNRHMKNRMVEEFSNLGLVETSAYFKKNCTPSQMKHLMTLLWAVDHDKYMDRRTPRWDNARRGTRDGLPEDLIVMALREQNEAIDDYYFDITEEKLEKLKEKYKLGQNRATTGTYAGMSARERDYYEDCQRKGKEPDPFHPDFPTKFAKKYDPLKSEYLPDDLDFDGKKKRSSKPTRYFDNREEYEQALIDDYYDSFQQSIMDNRQDYESFVRVLGHSDHFAAVFDKDRLLADMKAKYNDPDRPFTRRDVALHINEQFRKGFCDARAGNLREALEVQGKREFAAMTFSEASLSESVFNPKAPATAINVYNLLMADKERSEIECAFEAKRKNYKGKGLRDVQWLKGDFAEAKSGEEYSAMVRDKIEKLYLADSSDYMRDHYLRAFDETTGKELAAAYDQGLKTAGKRGMKKAARDKIESVIHTHSFSSLVEGRVPPGDIGDTEHQKFDNIPVAEYRYDLEPKNRFRARQVGSGDKGMAGLEKVTEANTESYIRRHGHRLIATIYNVHEDKAPIVFDPKRKSDPTLGTDSE